MEWASARSTCRTKPSNILGFVAFWGSESEQELQDRSSEALFISAEKCEVARAKGVGEKEKECTTECKIQRRLDEKAPRALNYGSGEGGGDEKGRSARRRGGEKRAIACVMCMRPMATGLPSALMLMHEGQRPS